ncbi:MAG: ABC transporter permease [Spirochaetia bacterium]|jgi:ribose/xylose/arabinose/galactoside ABC-type transport system permease subunit
MSDTSRAGDYRALRAGSFSSIVNTAGVYGIALLFVLLGAVLQVTGVIGNFLSPKNLLNIVDAVALVGIVAVGMGFVTYSGNFADLSVPTTMGFTGYICIELLRYGFVLAVLVALAVGLLIGLLNGFVVGKFKANPIIWTLAVNYVTMGMIRLIWANKQIYPDMRGSGQNAIALFDAIYRLRFFNLIGLPLVLLVVLVIIGQFVLTRTSFGIKLKLTGSSPRAAKLSGIAVERGIMLSFVLAAFTATIAGLAVTSLSRVGAWYNGAGYDFKAVTAVVIGGMTLAGGRGNILGVLGGSLIIGILNNIMTLLGVGTFSQDMVRGAIFIVVVGINALSLRRLGRDDA